MFQEYVDEKAGARISLIQGQPQSKDFNSPGQFLSFLWNIGEQPMELWIDSIHTVLLKNELISLTYLNRVEASMNTGVELVHLKFNREFYCVHTNDSEVSCNGLLFFGSNSSPKLSLDSAEDELLKIWLNVIRFEFKEMDGNQEEMLRILLKRFIIRCTRLAKKQLLFGDSTQDEIDIVRLYNVLVEEHYKTLKKVGSYAELMHRSPKTISNIFAKTQQITPLQVIHQRIILEADRLLRHSQLSFKEIAFELGYDDPAQFSKLYKTSKGVSMTEFRNLN